MFIKTMTRGEKNRFLLGSLLVLLVFFLSSVCCKKVFAEESEESGQSQMSLSFETTPNILYANIVAYPDGSTRIIDHDIKVDTDNPDGVRIFLSSANNKVAPVLDNALDGLSSASGVLASPTKMSSNMFGFAMAKDNNNDKTLKFSDETLYKTDSKDAKFAGIPDVDHSVEIYSGKSKTMKMYYGVNLNSLISDGRYNMDIIYTVVPNLPSTTDPTGGEKIELSPRLVTKTDSGQEVWVITDIKTNAILHGNDIDIQINDKPCVNPKVIQGLNLGKEIKDDLIIACTVPPNELGKYDFRLKIPKIKLGILKPQHIEYVKLQSMQEFTYQECKAMNNGDTKKLIDLRDGEIYKVAKLADGNCWMTENLRLRLSPEIKLESRLSNIRDSWAPSRETEIFNAYGYGQKWKDDVDGYDTVRSGYMLRSYRTSGVYYTYGAATAQSAVIESYNTDKKRGESICPSGWELPSSSSKYKKGEMWSLARAYRNAAIIGNGALYGVHSLLKNPVSIVRAGYYDATSSYVSTEYSRGYYWSNTFSEKDKAYGMHVNAVYASPHNHDLRYYGYSVRCKCIDSL